MHNTIHKSTEGAISMKHLFALCILVLVVGMLFPSDLSAQAKPWLLQGRRAVIDDSLRVGSTTTLNGAATLNSTLTVGTSIANVDSFATTALTDTVSLTGVTATSIILAGWRGSAAADTIGSILVQPGTDQFVVHRTTAGAEGGAKYWWVRLK